MGGKDFGEVLDDERPQRHDAGADNGAVTLECRKVGELGGVVGPIGRMDTGSLDFDELEEAEDRDEADPVVCYQSQWEWSRRGQRRREEDLHKTKSKDHGKRNLLPLGQHD